MKIEEVDIKYSYYCTGTGNMGGVDGVVHIKQLPYLSVVQSQTGSYGIRIDNGEEYCTGEGGFFIAPSLVTQTITHRLNPESGLFGMRYLFLDIIINNGLRFNDAFDVPLIPDSQLCERLSSEFDELEKTVDACEKKCILYRIVKLLIDAACEKRVKGNETTRRLVEYIYTNYADSITVTDMAQRVSMSVSNLFAVFKKATGMSPVRFLNEYRLSVASLLLLQTEDDIKSIAERVGISDRFYFSRLFKNKYGVSPVKYRKREPLE